MPNHSAPCQHFWSNTDELHREPSTLVSSALLPTVLAKSKSIKQPASKPNAIAPQSSEMVTKVSPVEESSFTTKVIPPAPTPTIETQPSKEARKQKTPKA